jgi:DNA-binding transcriptional LysR family regulator
MSLLGMGIALVSDTLIKAVSPSDDLLFYKINSQNTTRQLYILSKKNKHLNRAMLKFIQTAKEIYQ